MKPKTQMTIGRKISIGFGSVLMIITIVSGVTAYKMRQAVTSADGIARGRVPSSVLAAFIEVNLGDARIHMRGYSTSLDPLEAELALASVRAIRTNLADGKALVQARPELTILAGGIPKIEALLSEYDQLIHETLEAGSKLVSERAVVAQAGVEMDKAVTELVDDQSQAVTEALTANDLKDAPPRVSKLGAATRIQNLVGKGRALYWEGQAYRDIVRLDAADKLLIDAEKEADALRPKLAVPKVIAALQSAGKQIDVYQHSIKSSRLQLATLASVGKRRTALGESLSVEAVSILKGASGKATSIANESSEALVWSTRLVIASSISAVVLGAAVAFLIIRGTTRSLTRVASSLHDGAQQVAAASAQIAASGQSLAEGASEQAASLEETSASLEEITSMVKRNAEAAQTAKDLSAQTRCAADAGAADMEQMGQSMHAIKASSDDVANIIKNIHEIAFQTNVLALNAAVEAARAGQAGAGFAVVADEVRNLAQRSATAAKETAQKIEDAVTKITEGVKMSTKVAQSLHEIVTKARSVDTLVAEIALACTEQAQGITQVNVAVNQMDKVTQSNAASAEESASAAEELDAQAVSQKQAVEELLALVGANPRVRRASDVPPLSAGPSNQDHGEAPKRLAA